MLKLRIITAVLIAVLLPTVFHPNIFGLMTLVSLVVGLTFWEWCRLIGLTKIRSQLCGFGFSLTLFCFLYQFNINNIPAYWTAIGSIFWFVTFVFMILYGIQMWQRIGKSIRWIWGVFVLTISGFSILQSKLIGTHFLISVFCLIWAADIGAYFIGRAFGRHKLAAEISPGKTWEGVLGGVIFVWLVSSIWIFVESFFPINKSSSIYTMIWVRWEWFTPNFFINHCHLCSFRRSV